MKGVKITTNSAPKGVMESNVPIRESRLALFDHLPKKQIPKNPHMIDADPIIHPVTVKLGCLYSKGMILTDDDRVTTLIVAFSTIIKDYTTPPKKILREDLDKFICKQVQYLVDCRQLCKGMGNVIKFLRNSVSKITPETSEAEAKSVLLAKLQNFVEERIIVATECISKSLSTIIRENDVILTFGSSPLVHKALLTAATTKSFSLVVIDSRPLNEGLQTLSMLSHSVRCVYSPLSGAAAAMKDVTRVILGASSLLANGAMLASAGTAMVAALAKSRQIPVIVACESYKFSDRMQLDSIVHNELGHPSEIATTGKNEGNVSAVAPQRQPGYRGAAEKPAVGPSSVTDQEFVSIPTSWCQDSEVQQHLPFDVINLRYDLTPISHISVVVTETGMIPATSVPVLLREILSDMVMSGSGAAISAQNASAAA